MQGVGRAGRESDAAPVLQPGRLDHARGAATGARWVRTCQASKEIVPGAPCAKTGDQPGFGGTGIR